MVHFLPWPSITAGSSFWPGRQVVDTGAERAAPPGRRKGTPQDRCSTPQHQQVPKPCTDSTCSKCDCCFQHHTAPGFAVRPTFDFQYGLQVISKEANFVTVRVNTGDVTSNPNPQRTDLLCSVRALLKKIKQSVLVGDNVQVASIDWTDKRGMINYKCCQYKATCICLIFCTSLTCTSRQKQQLHMCLLLYSSACRADLS